jgi:hypothetical protein
MAPSFVRRRLHSQPATSDASYFPPLAWTNVLCASCGDHVGWHFDEATKGDGSGRGAHATPTPAPTPASARNRAKPYSYGDDRAVLQSYEGMHCSLGTGADCLSLTPLRLT